MNLPKAAMDKRKEPHKREAFAEELRVFYVALTRAKRRTTLFWGGFNLMGGSPAAFLFFPPPEKERAQVPKTSRLKDEPDAALLAGLRTLEASNAARVREMAWDFDTKALERTAAEKKSFAALAVERPVRAWQRVDSFSALTRRVVHAPDDDDVVRDREEGVETPVPEASPGPGERIVLDGFPRGRVSGDFFHAVLETIDFETATGADVLDVASEKLEAFGLSRGTSPDAVDRLLGQAVASIRDLLDTPLLPAGGVRLRDVPKASRFSELEFHLPVARDRGAADWLDRTALEAVFRDHPSPELPSAYAERVGRLGFAPLAGFLKGYVDLVFEHAGKWYVVDYKTNHLSDFVGEYDRERMTAAMTESHYFLQYHLYGLALSRFVARHQRGFDYERNFGGALYLFMKGMRPGNGTGVFFEKPPLARMRALDKAFGGSSW
jgi:exodeoxyribonuclease V beta subunit